MIGGKLSCYISTALKYGAQINAVGGKVTAGFDFIREPRWASNLLLPGGLFTSWAHTAELRQRGTICPRDMPHGTPLWIHKHSQKSPCILLHTDTVKTAHFNTRPNVKLASLLIYMLKTYHLAWTALSSFSQDAVITAVCLFQGSCAT